MKNFLIATLLGAVALSAHAESRLTVKGQMGVYARDIRNISIKRVGSGNGTPPSDFTLDISTALRTYRIPTSTYADASSLARDLQQGGADVECIPTQNTSTQVICELAGVSFQGVTSR